MKADYDIDEGILSLDTGMRSATSASLLDNPGIVVDLADADGHDIVGVTVMGADAYLPLKRGYDPDTDILHLGRKADSPDLITETGDFVGYWQVYEGEPDGFRDPIGVAIRNASKHLAPVVASLAKKKR